MSVRKGACILVWQAGLTNCWKSMTIVAEHESQAKRGAKPRIFAGLSFAAGSTLHRARAWFTILIAWMSLHKHQAE
jgi:hypothetical protein